MQGTAVEALLNADEVRAALRISKRTFELMVARGQAPRHLLVGRQRRWRKVDVVEWIDSMARTEHRGDRRLPAEPDQSTTAAVAGSTGPAPTVPGGPEREASGE